MNLKRIGLANIILFVGWAIYITSFFMPAFDRPNQIHGWAAALYSLLIIGFSPGGHFQPLQIYYFSLSLCNILMLLSPFIFFRTKKKKLYQWYRISMSVATLLVGSWFFFWFWYGEADALLIGYYLWFLSFLLVTVSLFMRRP